MNTVVQWADVIAGEPVQCRASHFTSDPSVGIGLQPDELSVLHFDGTEVDFDALSEADQQRLIDAACEQYEEQNQR